MSPTWEESFELLIFDPSITTLCLEVYDEDFKFAGVIGGDDLIGRCEVETKELKPDVVEERTLPLELDDGVEDEQVAKLGEPTLTIKVKFAVYIFCLIF